MLKRRFPCLRYGLRVSPERAIETIISCAILHNFGIVNGDSMPRQLDLHGNQLDEPVPVEEQGFRYRDLVAEQYFS